MKYDEWQNNNSAEALRSYAVVMKTIQFLLATRVTWIFSALSSFFAVTRKSSFEIRDTLFLNICFCTKKVNKVLYYKIHHIWKISHNRWMFIKSWIQEFRYISKINICTWCISRTLRRNGKNNNEPISFGRCDFPLFPLRNHFLNIAQK